MQIVSFYFLILVFLNLILMNKIVQFCLVLNFFVILILAFLYDYNRCQIIYPKQKTMTLYWIIKNNSERKQYSNYCQSTKLLQLMFFRHFNTSKTN